jgi:hypothetical protein
VYSENGSDTIHWIEGWEGYDRNTDLKRELERASGA